MIEAFHQQNPYGLDRMEKGRMLTEELKELTRFHQEHCPEYANFLGMVGYDANKVHVPADIPFFPVRLFKQFDLLSIDRRDVFKTMTSSGTTGQQVSKIFVDRETAMLQQKVMLRIGRYPRRSERPEVLHRPGRGDYGSSICRPGDGICSQRRYDAEC